MEKVGNNYPILTKLNSIDDLKKLNKNQIDNLRKEIRKKLIDMAKNSKIHLGSNLGIVELSIALLLEINHNETKLFYDTGHQCYVHKMLTGRFKKIDSIRKNNGLSGFPNHLESKLDFISTGHSSTSLSIAQGYNETSSKTKVIPIIGDAAINNGLALEALNDIAFRKNKMIIIVNDNGESISKTVGWLYKEMSKIKAKNFVFKIEKKVKKSFWKSPKSRKFFFKIFELVIKIENLIFGKNIYQAMGFLYVGAIDGHNIEKIRAGYQRALFYSQFKPVILHIKTTKSLGYSSYKKDENNHSLQIGEKKAELTFTSYASKIIEKYLQENKNIQIINSAMTIPGGYEAIEKKFSQNYQDVGINEEHAITKASGMAINHKKVFVPIYSTFLQRSYDQIHHDIARLQLPVVFLVDRADIASQDGDTHHGIYDVGMIKSIPNTIIAQPANKFELENLIDLAIKNDKNPFFIRFANTENQQTFDYQKFEMGQWVKINDINSNTVIVSFGYIVNDIYTQFKNEADIINAIFLNSYDKNYVFSMLKKYKKIIFYERIFASHTLCSEITSLFNSNNLQTAKIYGLAFKSMKIGFGDLNEININQKMDLKEIGQILKLKYNN